MKRRNVYTIGHSNRDLADFLTALQTFAVQQLVDVRSYPRSRFARFNGRALERSLQEKLLTYTPLGDLLGGKRLGGYEAYMQTQHFELGIERLEASARLMPTCIMCAERDPERCHRSRIADRLSERGWQVVHIINAQQAQPHSRRARQTALEDFIGAEQTPQLDAAEDGGKLFVYGSLRDPAVVLTHVGRSLPASAASLADFRRLTIPGYPYPAVIPAPGRTVRGQVLSGLRDADLQHLDAYEGVSDGLYERRMAVARDAARNTIAVFVYVAGTHLLARLNSRAG